MIPVRELAKLYDSYTKAVLLLLSETHIEEYMTEFERLLMPVVTVNKQYPFGCSVCTDHGQGVTLALEHLYGCGHRRIGMTVDRLDNQAGRERVGAYRTFFARHGEPALPVGLFCNLDAETSGRELNRVLAEKPTALIVCGESVALQSAYELRRRGVRIPEELSLITSELTDTCCWMTPELTAINQDLDALAAETVTLLMTRIRNPLAPHVHRRLATSLIVRNSVKPLAR
ncbi:Ribose operon repressor [bioreactor metagenome]|uniref:Ribose operon repressor n=1 Tax=bioreactor metagenome TaxID=1076179 RepID=A0A645F2Z1_9ZZZZ